MVFRGIFALDCGTKLSSSRGDDKLAAFSGFLVWHRHELFESKPCKLSKASRSRSAVAL